MDRPQAKWLISVGAATVLIGLAVCLYRSDPSHGGSRFLPRCGLYTWTGLHCPGCGNTRATYALLHGDIGSAVEQNMLFVMASPFLLFGAARTWCSWIFPGKIQPLPIRWRRSYSLFLVWVVIVFAVLRNIPQYPFTWLAPKLLKTVDPTEEHGELFLSVPPPRER